MGVATNGLKIKTSTQPLTPSTSCSTKTAKGERQDKKVLHLLKKKRNNFLLSFGLLKN